MQCEYIKPDGSRCQARALHGKSVCLFHDPASAAKRQAGRRRGGRNSNFRVITLPADTADSPLATVADVVALLGRTINQVLTGKIGVGVGNCVGQLGGVLLRALEGDEVERRLAELEAVRAPKPRGGRAS
jgi:hypothetical protein